MYFENLIQRIKLPFRKDKELYLCLYHILGFYPKNISYYKQALLHKSVSVKGKDGRYQNNERMEFLGDAILDAVVGDVVYRHFENKREGFLTNARSKLVQRETLGKLAVEIGLDRLIQSNQQQNNSHNSYMAGNAFEALVGAIYLDFGYERCMKFMEKRILNHIIDVDKVAYKEVNFKSKLLEWSQKNRIRLDFKDLHQTTDKDGAHVFHTMVVIEGLECGRGRGYSKKESQQSAAQESLIILKKHKGFQDSVFEAKSKRTAMEEQPEALLPEIPDEVLTANPKEKGQAKKKEEKQPEAKKEEAKAAPKKKEEKQPEGKKEETKAAPKKKEEKPAEAKKEEVKTTPKKKEEKPTEGKKEEVKAAPRRRRPAPEKKPIEQITESEKPVEETPIPEKPVENIPQTESPDSEDSVSETTDGAQPVKKKPRRRGSRRKETSLGDH